MRFKVQPATPALVQSLTPYVPNWPRAADNAPRVREGWAFVGMLDDQVVVGAGLDEIGWPGVAYAWLVVVPGASAWCPLSIARGLKQGLYALIARHRLWRVEANVHCQLARAIRLTEWLGFRRECTKGHWGPDGKDYHLYALITERFLP
jgi:hypothetical protein